MKHQYLYLSPQPHPHPYITELMFMNPERAGSNLHKVIYSFAGWQVQSYFRLVNTTYPKNSEWLSWEDAITEVDKRMQEDALTHWQERANNVNNTFVMPNFNAGDIVGKPVRREFTGKEIGQIVAVNVLGNDDVVATLSISDEEAAKLWGYELTVHLHKQPVKNTSTTLPPGAS